MEVSSFVILKMDVALVANINIMFIVKVAVESCRLDRELRCSSK